MKGLLATIAVIAIAGAVYVQVYAKGAGNRIKSAIGLGNAPQSNNVQTQTASASITSKPDVPPFHAVVIDGAFEIKLKQGTETTVSLDANAETLAKIKVEVVNGVLHIGARENNWTDNYGKVTATIETPNLDALTVNGSAGVSLTDLKTPKLAVTINGSSQVSAVGTADDLVFDISGSGSVDAKQLVSDSVTATISGSGDMDVNAQKSLTASIAGSGSIHYTGKPNVTQSVAGTGSVTPN